MNDSSAPPTYEIRDAAGSAVRIGDVISGDFTILRGVEPVGSFQLIGERVVDSLLPELQLSVPPAFTFTCSAFGSGDGRGGNARDRRRARRAGRIWQALGEVVRDGVELNNPARGQGRGQSNAVPQLLERRHQRLARAVL